MRDVYSLDDKIDGLIESIELARDQKAIKQTLRNFAGALGFTRFAYLNVKGSDIQALSNYPSEWQNLYLENRYAVIDPVVVIARRSMEVFRWSQDEMAGPSPETLHFFRQAADFGIRSGLSIPVRGGFGRTAMLTLASDQPRACFVEVRDAVRAVTGVAFVHAHFNFLTSIRCETPDVSLTPREAHCLAWASFGKTRAETAALLGIKEPTVRFYTESAFEKLGVVNIAHAVRVAIEKGLI